MNSFSPEETGRAAVLLAQKKNTEAWEVLLAPLHQRLVATQSFDILDELNPVARMMLILDYLEGQILGGGFIQLFQNGYAPLLLEGTEVLQELQLSPEMVQIFDEALKLFSTFVVELGRETTVQEFAKLYERFPQFRPLEAGFEKLLPELKINLIQQSMEEG